MWVVKVDKETALRRIKVRNPNLTDEEILNRLKNQPTDSERLKYATWSYDTSDQFTYEHNMKLVADKLN